MDLADIKKIAKSEADNREEKGTSDWHSLYYGFIYGYQRCQRDKLDLINYLKSELSKEKKVKMDKRINTDKIELLENIIHRLSD
jgi:hypothetical protein